MRLKASLSCLLITLLLCTNFITPFARPMDGRFFSLSNGLFFSSTQVDETIGITPSGKIAVGATIGFTTFEPATGREIQYMDTPFRPRTIAVADTPFGIRAVGVSDDRFRTATILDVSPTGQMAQIAEVRLTNTDVSFYSNVVLSSQAGVGFTLVHNPNILLNRDLVAFSLQDGTILDRLNVGFSFETLGMKECNGRRYVVFNRGFTPITLAVIDATDPNNLVDLGSVVLPNNSEGSGIPHTDYVFSSDCRYVFVANQFIDFTAVDLVNMRVADSFGSEFRFGKLRLYEDATTRMIAAQSADSGTVSGISALLLLDVSNAEDIRLINRKDILNGLRGFLIIQSDFTFTRSGKKICIALPDRLWVLEVPSLNLLEEEMVSGPEFGHANFVKSFGSSDRVLGAWNNVTFGSFDFSESGEFDLCVQDDGNNKLFLLNSTTGAYQFTDCSGITLSGEGIVRERGGVFTLQAGAGDYRVLAKIDTSTKRANASIQVLSQRRSFNIMDRNTADNACGCD